MLTQQALDMLRSLCGRLGGDFGGRKKEARGKPDYFFTIQTCKIPKKRITNDKKM